ncbi:hypothetical protein RRG08_057955, partial [Elysia crispata]
ADLNSIPELKMVDCTDQVNNAAVNQTGQTHCTTDGWFGPDCQYQCHCAGSAPCDKHDGSCSSGCHRAWFGPACQYDVDTSTLARMGFTVNGNFNPRWLTDNKDTTCNRGTLRSVTVTLDTPIPLTWLRVVVSDAGNEMFEDGKLLNR